MELFCTNNIKPVVATTSHSQSVAGQSMHLYSLHLNFLNLTVSCQTIQITQY